MKSSFLPHLLSYYDSEVIAAICEKYGYSPLEVIRKFFDSETYRMLSNPDLGMWDFCPDIIMDLWECEQVTGSPRNSSYIRGES